jgi:hypothetical protein
LRGKHSVFQNAIECQHPLATANGSVVNRVLCVSVVDKSLIKIHHGGAENTEVAQRFVQTDTTDQGRLLSGIAVTSEGHSVLVQFGISQACPAVTGNKTVAAAPHKYGYSNGDLRNILEGFRLATRINYVSASYNCEGR